MINGVSSHSSDSLTNNDPEEKYPETSDNAIKNLSDEILSETSSSVSEARRVVTHISSEKRTDGEPSLSTDSSESSSEGPISFPPADEIYEEAEDSETTTEKNSETESITPPLADEIYEETEDSDATKSEKCLKVCKVSAHICGFIGLCPIIGCSTCCVMSSMVSTIVCCVIATSPCWCSMGGALGSED